VGVTQHRILFVIFIGIHICYYFCIKAVKSWYIGKIHNSYICIQPLAKIYNEPVQVIMWLSDETQG